MKKKLPVGVSVLIALALVAFGLLYGTAGGYGAERAEAIALFEAENGLRDVLHYRAADGLNLCAVAGRHLGEQHEAVARLEKTARAMQEASEPAQCASLDAELDEYIRLMTDEMIRTSTFQASERDQRYLAMLENDLDSLSASAAASAYNQAAVDFNRQLDAPLLGGLAQLMGMQPLPLYGGVK